MAFKKRFTVSTEDVNTYGFVVLTSGIDLSVAEKNCPAFYDHNYWQGTIGHWEDFRIEGTNLTALFVSEGITDFEKEIIKKIEAGDVKGASGGFDDKEWNSDVSQMKTGQTKPTLSKSSLFEISVTPLPGNQSAISLKKDNEPIRLSAANVKNIIPQIKQEPDMKAIAVKLGLADTATESEIIKAIDNVLLTRDSNDTVVKEILEKESEGLDKEQKEIFVTLSKSNVKQAISYAQSLKADGAEETEAGKEETKTKLTKDVKVSDLIKLKKGDGTPSADNKDSFDYLSKHNPVELKRIRAEEPEKYAQLSREYAKGVRYTGKTA